MALLFAPGKIWQITATPFCASPENGLPLLYCYFWLAVLYNAHARPGWKAMVANGLRARLYLALFFDGFRCRPLMGVYYNCLRSRLSHSLGPTDYLSHWRSPPFLSESFQPGRARPPFVHDISPPLFTAAPEPCHTVARYSRRLSRPCRCPVSWGLAGLPAARLALRLGF